MAKKIVVPRFRQGQVVKATYNTVLVTGPGDSDVGYPCFAGVVVSKANHEDAYPIGMYSETWTKIAFKKVPLSINKVIKMAMVDIPSDL